MTTSPISRVVESNPLLDQSPVISVECTEPEGTIVRHVRFMQLSPENLRTFWEKSRKFPTLFGQEVSDDFRKFINLLVHEGPEGIEPNGLFWVIDNFVGVFYMTDIVPMDDANVHYTFFDRRQKGRLNLTKEMLKYIFERYQFRRVSVEVPLFVHKTTIQFIEDLGFIREGRKRKKAYYQGHYFDVACYGILKEECVNGK